MTKKFGNIGGHLHSFLAFDVAGVISVGIGLADLAVLVVDLEFRTGVAAHFAPMIDRFPFRVEVTTGALSAAATDVPACVRVGHNVMGPGSLAALCHLKSPQLKSTNPAIC